MTSWEPMAMARKATMSNKNYRCYFTDTGDRIRTYEQIDCADDTTAALKVDELLSVLPSVSSRRQLDEHQRALFLAATSRRQLSQLDFIVGVTM